MRTVSINTQFPGYELMGELGRSNARVVKARHTETGDLVAIKQFALNTDADTLRRFQQESEIMTGITHPNVVKVREIHLDAAMPYLVMEFIEGGDLRSLLKGGGRLDVPTTLRLGLQMAEAFRAIHAKGIVHRDIKPENILYRQLPSGELHFLLTDFGVAKIRADESARTRTGHSLMTYEYAAPEQFDNPQQVDEATDYYSLGVVLYECLSGQAPFVLQEGNGLAVFINRVLTSVPAPLVLAPDHYLPPTLNDLIQRLLDKNNGRRLRDAGELELALEQSKIELLKAKARPPGSLPGPAPVPAASGSRPSPPPPAREPASGGGWWWSVLLVGVAVALAIAWLLFYRNNGSRGERSGNGPESTLVSPEDTSSAILNEADELPAAGDSAASDPQFSEEGERGGEERPAETRPDSTVVPPPADSVSTAPPDSTRSN